ncbi:MAG TPA: flagellar hook-basal body complex protein FliE [Sphingomonas sp.]|uniref:flagellar hook-basal body complex protein FliE n=1 Tax=Sphingomonas sp. TaxID=28214 RepID=UPI002BE93139|nr:flagellar hook-basal body complex protein FliE [Sphingomonas sp.]HMI18003.1 flagellar hook-basal body complex protein FliE [Sphingomonas sp.]
MSAISPATLLQMRSAILQQNSALQKAAADAAQPIGNIAGIGGAGGVGGANNGGGFASALDGALKQVNGMQANADSVTSSYERGETTDIAAVMLAREKASVGFQATLQVRNKLLSAYKDIMSMPV